MVVRRGPVSLSSCLLPLRSNLQGLRSITQTTGCFVSLYVISPKLTGLLVVVMPVLVGTGAFLGSFLRQLSRSAQDQVRGSCWAA